MVKPAKKNVFWPVAGISNFYRSYIKKVYAFTYLQLYKKLVIAICCITFIGILIFYDA
ncbi:DUF443 family protein [Staphylococcus aureus]